MSLCTYSIALGIPTLVAPPGPWEINTAYILGAKVINAGNIYSCSQAGMSAGAGPGPTGTGSAIPDNAAKWDFVAAVPTIPALPSLTLPTPPCLLDEF